MGRYIYCALQQAIPWLYQYIGCPTRASYTCMVSRGVEFHNYRIKVPYDKATSIYICFTWCIFCIMDSLTKDHDRDTLLNANELWCFNDFRLLQLFKI